MHNPTSNRYFSVSPYGMQMPNRHFSSADSYRYGFNGMEADDEMKGTGNSYTTEFRQYDPRIARWLSIDPEFTSFPWQSPYVAFDNNPIYFKDPKGDVSEVASTQDGTPEERRLKLTRKASNELLKNNGNQTRKYRRLQVKIERINKRLNGGNNGTNTPKVAVFGKGDESRGDDGLLGNRIEYTIVHEPSHFNQIGFKAARIDENGNVDIFEVGRVMDGAESYPIPRWPEGNEYGQPAGSEVIVDDEGNIVAPDGEVLIPKLEGVDINDGLYEKGDILHSGKVAENDSIIRKEMKIERDSNGSFTDRTGESKRTDITEKVEDEN